MKKLGLAGLVFVSAMTFVGPKSYGDDLNHVMGANLQASKSDHTIHLVDDSTSKDDLIDKVKKNPPYLMKFLEDEKGKNGMVVLPEDNDGFISYYYIQGKEDTLIVFARYDQKNNESVLRDYSVYDLGEDTLMYKIDNDSQSTPTPGQEGPKQKPEQLDNKA